MMEWLTKPTLADWLSVACSAVLVWITARYVSFTKQIMRASVQQAEAANVTARTSVQQWKLQQVERLLPIKLAIMGVNSRIDEFRTLTKRRDAALLDIVFHSAGLDRALAITSATSRVMAVNMEHAISEFAVADRYLQSLRDVQAPWETPEIQQVDKHLKSAQWALGVVTRWLKPLLEPVEDVAYPDVDEDLMALIKEYGE